MALHLQLITQGRKIGTLIWKLTLPSSSSNQRRKLWTAWCSIKSLTCVRACWPCWPLNNLCFILVLSSNRYPVFSLSSQMYRQRHAYFGPLRLLLLNCTIEWQLWTSWPDNLCCTLCHTRGLRHRQSHRFWKNNDIILIQRYDHSNQAGGQVIYPNLEYLPLTFVLLMNGSADEYIALGRGSRRLYKFCFETLFLPRGLARIGLLHSLEN